MDDLTYRIPPDILHYEPRLVFGLSATEIMIGAMLGMTGMLLLGPLLGLLVGLLSLLFLRRFDGLGGRSVVVWGALMLWYRHRPGHTTIPRTLPPTAERLVVQDWDGRTLYTVRKETQS